jgi:uncharacterized protein YdiU (UPF0061 family)
MGTASLGWNFDNTYSRLPADFFSAQQPTPVQSPTLVVFNHALARELGLEAQALDSPTGALQFAGNVIPDGAQPLAQAYAGHQFGNFTMLGDGRAILLGEHVTPQGKRFDIQLKGSGRTRYSRRGDGRAALGPMLREYIISEAMHALRIPTTRSLAVVTTGEPVYRETVLPGAILTRVAASHLRVGTFEYLAAKGDANALRTLADYTVSRHYPELIGTENPYLGLLQAVMKRQAELVARWLQVGFIHGVMNTDNMAISGETIDYGPCAFMDEYDPGTVFSSIDQQGRYAYGNQPQIAQWNLARFAETLLPLLGPSEDQAIERAQKTLEGFGLEFQQHWLGGMRKKLGLETEESGDAELIGHFLGWMQKTRADFTRSFRALSTGTLIPDPEWMERWKDRLARERRSMPDTLQAMRQVNPAVIARNHRVEQALAAATEKADLVPLKNLVEALQHPFDESLDSSELANPPQAHERVEATFCGT